MKSKSDTSLKKDLANLKIKTKMAVLFPPTAGELEGVEAASSLTYCGMLVYCADQLGTVETPGNGTYTGMPINFAYHAYCSEWVGTA